MPTDSAIRRTDSSRLGDSTPIFRVGNATLAEYLRIALALHEIRSALWIRDPLRLGSAFVDVVVLAEEHDRALALLDQSRAACHTEDWVCPICEEQVPKTFDYCWNCSQLHPELCDDSISEQEVMVVTTH